MLIFPNVLNGIFVVLFQGSALQQNPRDRAQHFPESEASQHAVIAPVLGSWAAMAAPFYAN